MNLADNDRVFGATESILQISGVTSSDTANYSVIVKDPVLNLSVTSGDRHKQLVGDRDPRSGHK